jgi:hypothetical protein
MKVLISDPSRRVCHVNVSKTEVSSPPIPSNQFKAYCQLFCRIMPHRGVREKIKPAPFNQPKCHNVLRLFRFGDQIAIINLPPCSGSNLSRIELCGLQRQAYFSSCLWTFNSRPLLQDRRDVGQKKRLGSRSYRAYGNRIIGVCGAT